MPIVFVHGVNTRREDPDYDATVARTRQYLRDILAKRIGIAPDKLSTYFPYWGDHAVKFRWNQASLPGEATDVETLSVSGTGTETLDYELWLGEARFQNGFGEVNFGQVSLQKGFEEAVDLLWDTAASVVSSEAEHEEIIGLYNASLAYAKSHPSPKWATQTPSLSNQEFVNALLDAIRSEPPVAQAPVLVSLSLGDWWQSFTETVKRLGSAPSAAATDILVTAGRRSVHEKAARFLGDIFVYLTERGTVDAPGEIIRDILSSIDDAVKKKQAGDDKLVVIGHSLGGVILYDILTHFRPDLTFDIFATIGSQVALFEEMTLYRASDPSKPVNPPTDLLDKPDRVVKWLNVFDTNDVFSFKVEKVFKGASDFKFDTGYGLLQSHSGYFARPSFYKRLGARLGPVKP